MNRKLVSIFLLMTILIAVLTSTVNASASAKAFGNGKSGYADDAVAYAKYGLQKLSYSVSTSIGDISRSSILSWIKNTGNGYGFYIHTLGGSGYFNDYSGKSIDKDDISGNWDLVFIDSSKSGATNELAKAFNTVGYSKRCFLGWSTSVTASNATQFGYYFWTEYVSHASIHSSALSAASKVPGSGTTPIRLYGSTSYDGKAR